MIVSNLKPVRENPEAKRKRQLDHAYAHRKQRSIKAMNKRKKTLPRALKTKRKPKSEWKKAVVRLDTLVREIIKRRDRACVTCGATHGLQVGHLIKRGKYPVRWDLTNVAAQCSACNYKHNFYPEVYTLWYIKKYSVREYDELIQHSLTSFNRALVPVIEQFLSDTLTALKGGKRCQE